MTALEGAVDVETDTEGVSNAEDPVVGEGAVGLESEIESEEMLPSLVSFLEATFRVLQKTLKPMKILPTIVFGAAQ